MKRALISLVGSVVLFGAVPAFAERVPAEREPIQILPSLPLEGKFSMTPVSTGSVFTVGGGMISQGSQNLATVNTLFAQSVSGAGTATVNQRGFTETFGPPVVVGFGLNYGLSNRAEIFMNFRYMHAEARPFTLVTFTGGPVTWGGQSFPDGSSANGKFNAYNEYGLDFGYRRFFKLEDSRFHPFLSGTLGMKRNDNLTLTITSPSGVTVATKEHFYNAGLVANIGMGTGFRYDFDETYAIGMETGLRYEGPLSPNKAPLYATGGLSHINNAGDRVDIPVLVGLTAKF